MKDADANPITLTEAHAWRQHPMRAWIVRHDHSLSFAGVYISLTILLSILVSYFWLLALVALHILLEWLKKGYLGYRPGLHRTAWTLWDTKFDIALICMAFTLLTYTGIPAGAAGAQSAGRLALLGRQMGALTQRASPLLTRLAKVGALTRAAGIKGIDIFFSARVLLFRKADMARAAADEAHLLPLADRPVIPAHLPWQERLTGGGRFALIVIAINLVAIVISPLITDHSYLSVLQTLGSKLHPWPG